MEWHVTIFGDLEFPPGGVDRWRALSPDPEAYDDAADLGGAALGRAKVSEVLDALAGLHDKPGPPGRVDVKAAGARVTVRGYLADEGYHAWLGQAVTALRGASEAGAQGAIYVAHVDGELGYEITIDPKGSKVTVLKGSKKVGRVARTPAGKAAAALYAASFGDDDDDDALVLPPSPEAVEASRAIASKLLEQPAAGAHKALLARDPVVVLGPGLMFPTNEAFPSPASFTEALRNLAGADPLTAIALDLIAKLDAKSAPPLAVRALSARVGAETTAAAARIVASAPPAGASRALLDAIDVPPREGYNAGRDQIVAVLKEIRGDDIGAEALARLTPALLAQRDASAVIASLLDVAEARAAIVPEPVWLALFRRAEPLIRTRAAEALLAKGSKEALATIAGAIGEPSPLGDVAARALFALDPAKAFDAVAPKLSGDLSKPPLSAMANNVFGHLFDDVSKHKARSAALKDPRWIDLALRAPDARGAVLFLGYTSDPRVPPALAALAGKGIAIEDACESLKRIGDPSVVPALEAALPKAPHPYTKKLLQKTIEKLSGKPDAGAKAPSPAKAKSPRSAKK